MKQVTAIMMLLSMTGCVTDHRAMLDPFMKLQNITEPFVSQSFAERLARLVIEEKYPKNIFSIRGSGNIIDRGDTWWVTFDNAINGSMGAIIPRRLTVHIRKSNGEIVTIT